MKYTFETDQEEEARILMNAHAVHAELWGLRERLLKIRKHSDQDAVDIDWLLRELPPELEL